MSWINLSREKKILEAWALESNSSFLENDETMPSYWKERGNRGYMFPYEFETLEQFQSLWGKIIDEKSDYMSEINKAVEVSVMKSKPRECDVSINLDDESKMPEYTYVMQ